MIREFWSGFIGFRFWRWVRLMHRIKRLKVHVAHPGWNGQALSSIAVWQTDFILSRAAELMLFSPSLMCLHRRASWVALMVAATPNASTSIGSRFSPVLYRSNAAMIPLTVAMYEFEVILSRPISGNLVYPARKPFSSSSEFTISDTYKSLGK